MIQLLWTCLSGFCSLRPWRCSCTPCENIPGHVNHMELWHFAGPTTASRRHQDVETSAFSSFSLLKKEVHLSSKSVNLFKGSSNRKNFLLALSSCSSRCATCWRALPNGCPSKTFTTSTTASSERIAPKRWKKEPRGHDMCPQALCHAEAEAPGGARPETFSFAKKLN